MLELLLKECGWLNSDVSPVIVLGSFSVELYDVVEVPTLVVISDRNIELPFIRNSTNNGGI